MYMIMQPSLLSDSRMFSWPQKETLCPLVAVPYSSFTLAPGNHWYTFCIYRFASSGHTVKVEAYSKCLLCLDFFHLAYFQSYSCVACSRTWFFFMIESYSIVWTCPILLSVYQLMVVWVVSTFWPLWIIIVIVLLGNTAMNFCGHMFSIL